jgi:hypothetical protein
MGATLPEETPPADGPVEQYARLAAFLAERPDLAEMLLDVGEKLATAQDMRWTGCIQIDLMTGTVRGGPTLKAT